jgi:hypothetical protein
MDERRGFSEDRLSGAAVLLIFQEFGVFFSFSTSASLARGTPLPSGTLLAPRRFGILSIDFGHDIANLGVGVGFNEMAEEVCQAEEVSKSTNSVIFLEAQLDRSVS